MSETVLMSRDGGVCEITFNRPHQLNAMTWQLLDEWSAALDEADRDPDVRAIVLTGAGRAFSAGFDWNEDYSAVYGPHLERNVRTTPFARGGANLLRIWETNKPVVAAVNGPAVGGGLATACVCDFRVASDRASFSSIFVKRAIPPDGGLTFLLPRIVGLTHAFDLMATGRTIEAEEAARIGLVNRVVPHDELMKTAREVAAELATGPSLAIEYTKKLIHRNLEVTDLVAAMGFEALGQRVCMESDDAQEGARAFLEKRQPSFRGR